MRMILTPGLRVLAAAFAAALWLAPSDAAAREAPRTDPRAVIPVRVAPETAGAVRVVRTDCRPAPADGCCPVDCCGRRTTRWQVTLEGGVTLAPSPDGLLGGVASGDPTQLAWNPIDYDIAPAARLTIQYGLNARDRLFVRGTLHGVVEDEFTGTGVIGFSTTPAAAPGATTANTATFHSRMESESAELGWWRRLRKCGRFCVDVGSAVRMFHYHEPTRVEDFAASTLRGAPPPELDALAHNLFFGFQPAARIQYPLPGNLEAFASAKVFAGGVLQELEVSDTNFFSAGPHMNTSDRVEFAWGGELEVGASWRMNRRFGVTASYNVLFFDGLVRGADVYDFSQSATGAVETRHEESSIVLQTLFVGVTIQI